MCSMLHNSATSGVVVFATSTAIHVPKSYGNVENLTAAGMVHASDESLDCRYSISFVHDVYVN